MCYVIYKQTTEGTQEAVCWLIDKDTAKWFADLIEEKDNTDVAVVPYRTADAIRQRITYFEKVLDIYAPEQ